MQLHFFLTQGQRIYSTQANLKQKICLWFLIGPFLTLILISVVVMVMDMENKFARPVAHLYKGQTFGVSITYVIFSQSLTQDLKQKRL